MRLGSVGAFAAGRLQKVRKKASFLTVKWLQEQLAERQVGQQELTQLIDPDESGVITFEEFRDCLTCNAIDIHMSMKDMRLMMKKLDTNGPSASVP